MLKQRPKKRTGLGPPSPLSDSQKMTGKRENSAARSGALESAQTLSLAREERKGKEVIRLTPDATRGLGDRQAPAPKMPSMPSPASIRSSRRESAQTLSLAREERKGKEVIRLTPDATRGAWRST